MKLFCIALLAGAALFGCSKEKEMGSELPEEVKIEVSMGETYDDVLEKLGKPNIDSEGENSRILIYDDMEIKLQSNVVTEVFDHRPE